ncbi:hypothetical protein BD413DRAFT_114412 [Trametes elegans]|nr:hypothetical protein BD413DRAFT_114412 [Trametes elegans]
MLLFHLSCDLEPAIFSSFPSTSIPLCPYCESYLIALDTTCHITRTAIGPSAAGNYLCFAHCGGVSVEETLVSHFSTTPDDGPAQASVGVTFCPALCPHLYLRVLAGLFQVSNRERACLQHTQPLPHCGFQGRDRTTPHPRMEPKHRGANTTDLGATPASSVYPRSALSPRSHAPTTRPRHRAPRRPRLLSSLGMERSRYTGCTPGQVRRRWRPGPSLRSTPRAQRNVLSWTPEPFGARMQIASSSQAWLVIGTRWDCRCAPSGQGLTSLR